MICPSCKTCSDFGWNKRKCGSSGSAAAQEHLKFSSEQSIYTVELISNGSVEL